jgi:hypothetical protein
LLPALALASRVNPGRGRPLARDPGLERFEGRPAVLVPDLADTLLDVAPVDALSALPNGLLRLVLHDVHAVRACGVLAVVADLLAALAHGRSARWRSSPLHAARQVRPRLRA